MKNILFHILFLMLLLNVGALYAQRTNKAVGESPTEGVINHKFVPENQMMDGILQMMAKFSPYLVKNFVDEGQRNTERVPVGGFKSMLTMTSDEDGIRTTSDLGLACAFLYKYGKEKNVTLPDSISYDKIYDMAKKSLVFTYSSHRSQCLYRCKDNNYWGSSQGVFIQFESSLWAMGMAYQAYFLWDSLSTREKEHVRRVLEFECNKVNSMPIVCNFPSNTMAEENGWDACVLAAYVGLFPDHSLSPVFFNKLRRVAVNVLSHKSDTKNNSVIDTHIDSMRIRNFHVGNNLFADYTLQNHGYFHPGYQNVAIQELGEAALALSLFQKDIHGKIRYSTKSLFHNCALVQDSVLLYLALPDGELAMPNGNDWSLFLYDQIATYSTLACFLHNPDALMLENQAYKLIKARQSTTSDGSWLLNPDIDQRRMGVQAHRVIMSYLMHQLQSTAKMKPTRWKSLMDKVYDTKLFECQNFIRAWSKERFVAFSLTSNYMYGGYFTPNRPDINKIVVPFSRYATGSMLGYYVLRNGSVGAKFKGAPKYQISGNSFVLDADFNVCSNSMQRNITVFCTPGNAVITLDMIKNGASENKLTEQNAAMLGISFDPFTSIRRTFHYEGGSNLLYDTTAWTQPTRWLNIDNQIGVINLGEKPNMMLSTCYNNSSIRTRLLSAQYSKLPRMLVPGEIACPTAMVYLCNISAADTRKNAQASMSLTEYLPEGWMGVITGDAYGTYVLVSNLFGVRKNARLKNMPYQGDTYFPVFGKSMEISDSTVSVLVATDDNRSQGLRAGFFVRGNNIKVSSISADSISISATQNTRISLAYSRPGSGKLVEIRNISLPKDSTATFHWDGGKIRRR